MKTFRSFSLFVFVLGNISSLLLLAGCGPGTVRGLQEADNQNCQQMGLYPGTRAYADCMSTGSARYASQHSFSDNNRRHDNHWGDDNHGRNNKCEAPASSPTGACASCQVSCGPDKQASCQQGQEDGGGMVPVTCIRNASCECH